MAFGVYHDVDGCAFIGHDRRMVYRSTFYCRHNPINTPQVRDGLLSHRVLGKELIKMFEAEFGDVTDPSGLIRMGEYGRFDPKPKTLGLAINKEALAEIERRATENLPLEAFYQSLREAQLTPGLEDFAGWVKSNGGRQIIVTDGWDIVGNYLAERIGADRVEGAIPMFNGGRFTGEVYKPEDKKPIVSDLLRSLGLTYGDSIGIDDWSDVVVRFGLPIAFNSSNPGLVEAVKKHSNGVIVEEPHYKHVQKAAEEWLSKR